MKTTKEERDEAREHYTDPGFLYPSEQEFIARLLDDADRCAELEMKWLLDNEAHAAVAFHLGRRSCTQLVEVLTREKNKRIAELEDALDDALDDADRCEELEKRVKYLESIVDRESDAIGEMDRLHQATREVAAEMREWSPRGAQETDIVCDIAKWADKLTKGTP